MTPARLQRRRNRLRPVEPIVVQRLRLLALFLVDRGELDLAAAARNIAALLEDAEAAA